MSYGDNNYRNYDDQRYSRGRRGTTQSAPQSTPQSRSGVTPPDPSRSVPGSRDRAGRTGGTYGDTGRGSYDDRSGRMPAGRGSYDDRSGRMPANRGSYEPAQQSQRYTPQVPEEPKKRSLWFGERASGNDLVSKCSKVSVRGRVVSIQPRQRRVDFFHVLFDTLFGGAPMNFDPALQVLTVDLNEQDHTRVDAQSNRSVVVNLVGQMYDGTINTRDTVEVTGHWTKNGTINATRVFNHTNSSRIAMTPGVPAFLIRAVAILLLVGIALMFLVPVFQGKDLGQAFQEFLLKLVPFLIVLVLMIWCMRRPRRRGMFFFRRIFRWVILILAVLLLWKLAPDVLTALLTVGLTIWAIWLMVKAVIR